MNSIFLTFYEWCHPYICEKSNLKTEKMHIKCSVHIGDKILLKYPLNNRTTKMIISFIQFYKTKHHLKNAFYKNLYANGIFKLIFEIRYSLQSFFVDTTLT